MPKCIIDGKEYEFKPGENVIQIADRNRVEIPRFCYHPGLTVVAQCRMCVVEVEKMPKLQTSCSLPATDGMVVHIKSEKVKKMQASVMEFLLINHPLDCPICDKSGECDLQDYSFKYGHSDTKYEEYRRTYIDLDMGSVIKKNMNRCIHCTRCIRFCDEISGYREMVALRRGNFTEITTVDGGPLQTKYAGNLADVCPTGSLTLKEFRFKKRIWYLKKTQSVCEGCAQGCNIEVHHENDVVYRLMPRYNPEINKWWLCDEGRFNFSYIHSPLRIIEPIIAESTTDWMAAIQKAKSFLVGKVLVLAGTDLTLEEMSAIQRFSKDHFKDFSMFYFGTPKILTANDDKPEDKLLRRLSKTSNLHGAETLGLKPWENKGTYDCAFILHGGRAVLPSDLKKHVKDSLVGLGVFQKEEIANLDVVLPSCSYAEKSGTVVNWQGKEQKFLKAIEPRGDSKNILDVFSMWG